jgi:beta-ketodecanoyl-[acyl-carrier-protein] synthase
LTDIAISGTGLFTPPNRITNAELVEAFNTYVARFNAANAAQIEAGSIEALQPSSTEFIMKASGIANRYVMDKTGILDPELMTPRIAERPNEQISILAEMAVAAAREALVQAGREPADIDCIVCAASNMQRAYPALACEIQSKLGTAGFGFDMNVACSSATFGIQVAADMIRAGNARAAIVVNPEICTGHLNFRDRDSHFIFGDAATAIVLERAERSTSAHKFDILGTRLFTQFSNNIRNNFGFLNRCAPEGIGAPDKLFVQEGRKVFREVVPAVADLILAHLGELAIAPDHIKRMWLHQANLNMNVLVSRKVMGREPSAEDAPTILDEYANTSSAGSIIAFHKNKADFRQGDLGLICSFGAGYSIGNVVVRKAA